MVKQQPKTPAYAPLMQRLMVAYILMDPRRRCFMLIISILILLVILYRGVVIDMVVLIEVVIINELLLMV